MMRLTQPRRSRAESVVPMINVAFLVLIFFLMSAVIAPPEPFRVETPTASSEAAETDDLLLLVTRDGTLARGQLRGTAVYDDLAGKALRLRADAELDAGTLAQVLSRLREAGVNRVSLLTRTN